MIQSAPTNKPLQYTRHSRYSGKQYLLDIAGKSFQSDTIDKNQDYFPNNNNNNSNNNNNNNNDKPFNYGGGGGGGQSTFPDLNRSNDQDQTTAPTSTASSNENLPNYASYQKSFSQQNPTATSSTADHERKKGAANSSTHVSPTKPHRSLSSQSGDSCCSNSNHDDGAESETEEGVGVGSLGVGVGKERARIYGHFKAYKCFHCSKSFNRRTYLKSHERVHSGEKPFSCMYCQKSFAQRTNLRSHERTHTGEKPYVCLVCQRAFCQLNELRSHERVHTGARPYQCVYCPKAFTQLTNLRNHIRTHTGEKPYVCMVCTRSFAQHNELKSHERIHTGEKPYSCSFCSKAFSQRTNLRNHERVHSGEKPYQCAFCSKAFSQRGTLKNHELTHTLDKSSSRKGHRGSMGAHPLGDDPDPTRMKNIEKTDDQHLDPELIVAATAAEEEGCGDEQDDAPSQLPTTKYQSSSKWGLSVSPIQRGHNSTSSVHLPRTAHTNSLERSCMRQEIQQEHQTSPGSSTSSSSMRLQQIPSIPSMLVTPPYLHQMNSGWDNSYGWSRGFSMASGWASGGKNLPSHEGKPRKHRGIAEKGKKNL